MDVDIQEIFPLSHPYLLLIDEDNEVLMLLLYIFADLSIEKAIDGGFGIVAVHGFRYMRDHQHLFLNLGQF